MELPEILRVTVDGKIGPVGILLLLLDVCGILLQCKVTLCNDRVGYKLLANSIPKYS